MPQLSMRPRSPRIHPKPFIPLLALAALAATSLAAHAEIPYNAFPNATNIGPSTTRSPYVLPLGNPFYKTVSILTVGSKDISGADHTDTIYNPPSGLTNYVMAGKADGLGAFSNGDGTFTLLMAHEMGTSEGATRTHGAKGAFIDKWIINSSTLAVVSGQDLIQNVALWNTTTSSYNAPTTGAAVVMGNFCSGDLAPISALYNPATGLGFNGRIFFNGEENSTGRSFAHVVTGSEAGTSFQLARFGRQQIENLLLNPYAQNTTIAAVNEDLSSGSPVGQVNFYIGTKTNTGSSIDKAGLTNGSLYGLQVNGLISEIQTTGLGASPTKRFKLVDLGNQSNKTSAQLATDVANNSVMSFFRPEDGAWDPSNAADYYFVSTGQNASNPSASLYPTRLWRIRFDNITAPTANSGDGFGGTLELLYQGGTGTGENAPINMDNLTITSDGRILLQEDVGSSTRSGRIWQYSIADDTMTEVAKHDPARFGDKTPSVIAASALFGSSEESTGIIDASDILGPGWFLMDVQAHYSGTGNGITTTMVEGGQLLAFYIPEPASLALLTAAAPFLLLRRRKTC